MNSKERYWTFVLYPESAPEDWREKLQSLGLQCAVSPLHNMDVNPTGEVKKAHYHVLLCFNGPTTYNRVLDITKSLNCTIPQRVLSCVGIIRYFTHKDNPEKYQYNDEEITVINGLDLKTFNDLTETQIITLKKEIISYINDNGIKYYHQLIDCFRNNYCDNDKFRVVSGNVFFFRSYINSIKEKEYEDRQEINYRR